MVAKNLEIDKLAVGFNSWAQYDIKKAEIDERFAKKSERVVR